ncbi:hypothetical protein BHE74_00016883, partial [Ensete ventricosum]
PIKVRAFFAFQPFFPRLGVVLVILGDGGSQAGGDHHASAHGSAPGVRVLHRLQSFLGYARLLIPLLLLFCSPVVLVWAFVTAHSIAGEAIALGFQHYVLALGTAVMIPTFLVPLMGGSDVRLAYFLFLHQVGRCVEIGVPMLILFVASSQVQIYLIVIQL